MTAIISDIDELASPFKEKAYYLMELIERAELPFRLFETRRSFTRSQSLFMQGREYKDGVLKITGNVVTNARPGQSPHNFGLALDCVLIPREHSWWDGHHATGPWDTGYDGNRLVRPLAKLAWEKYGNAVRQAGLIYGGDWRFKDLPHAELPQWKTLRPNNLQEVVLRELAAGR